jgi:hypothetical protein
MLEFLSFSVLCVSLEERTSTPAWEVVTFSLGYFCYICFLSLYMCVMQFWGCSADCTGVRVPFRRQHPPPHGRWYLSPWHSWLHYTLSHVRLGCGGVNIIVTILAIWQCNLVSLVSVAVILLVILLEDIEEAIANSWLVDIPSGLGSELARLWCACWGGHGRVRSFCSIGSYYGSYFEKESHVWLVLYLEI